MKLLNKLSNWYFSSKFLPRWGILLIDCAIIFIASIIAGCLFAPSLSAIHIGRLCFMCLVVTVLYAISFRIFHTYIGIIRYSSFVDLQRIIAAMFCGTLVIWGLFYVIQLLFHIDIPYLTTWRELDIVFLIGTLTIWLERVAVKTLYDLFRMNDNMKSVFIYGVNKGGASLAKNIRNPRTSKI